MFVRLFVRVLGRAVVTADGDGDGVIDNVRSGLSLASGLIPIQLRGQTESDTVARLYITTNKAEGQHSSFCAIS